jgi:hypothetical protein
MKLGTLVTNDELGNGIVIEEYGKSVAMVMWYEGEIPSSTIITIGSNEFFFGTGRGWYAPSDLGRVFIVSE